MTEATWEILEGDCLDRMGEMPDQSVHCCVTSPPYFGLRDYGHDGQLGLEDSPAEYVEALLRRFEVLHRVLRDDGTLWLNLGDRYATTANAGTGWDSSRLTKANGRARKIQVAREASMRQPASFGGAKIKDLLGIPWMVAFALREQGWYLRSEIIWAKRNLTPEAVTDRPTKAHEQIFLLSKQPRYFYDAAAIAEPIDPDQYEHNQRYAKVYDAHTARVENGRGEPGNVNNIGIHGRRGADTRNKRTVWTISTVPLKEEHPAAFPPKLVEPCILAGCPEGGIVLDPFSGAGTTGLTALRLSRSYIGIELNPAYAAMSRERIRQDAPLLNTPAERAA